MKLKTLGDTILLQKIMLVQELWERYRNAHCNCCIAEGNKTDMIEYVKCAAELTAKRREELQRMYGY